MQLLKISFDAIYMNMQVCQKHSLQQEDVQHFFSLLCFKLSQQQQICTLLREALAF